MRILFLAAATALTLAACSRADTPPADAAEDASAAEDSARPAAAASTATRSDGAAMQAETLEAGQYAEPAAANPGPGPVSQAQRDGAKEAAEATNLHPRTP